MGKLPPLAAALASALVVPFVVTGLFRVLPGKTPFVVPFAVLVLVAGVIALAAPKRYRPVAAGTVAGCALYAVVLAWIVADMSSL